MTNLSRLLVGLIISLNLNAVGAHGNISYALPDAAGVPLDHKLLKIMPYRNGTFIEVGALDGNKLSNTKLFEEFYNWTGILVEPSPGLFSALIKNRPKSRCFSCALGAFEQDGSFVYGDFDGHPMASLTGRLDRPTGICVPMRSLQSILDECNMYHIDFFSLDTEGYELNILKGIDFERTTFDYLLIEIYTHQYNDIVSFLDEKGYELISCFSNYNKVDNPGWDGTHNDYLFKRKNLSIKHFVEKR